MLGAKWLNKGKNVMITISLRITIIIHVVTTTTLAATSYASEALSMTGLHSTPP
jgi:hypothetical protein